MKQQHLEQLARIYNTLATISTRGDDTITMGDCLKALRQEIETMNKELQEEAISENKETAE